MRRALIFALGLLGCAALAAAAPLTIEKLLDIEQVRACDLSPDGRLAAYTVSVNRALDEPAGGAWSRLWVVATDGRSEPRPFVTGEVSVGDPSFSPDGRFLAFTMKRGQDAETQVWVIPVHGGEALPATVSPTGVGAYCWSADGASLFYVDTEPEPEHYEGLREKKQLPRWFEEDLRARPLRRVAFTRGGEIPAPETLVDGLAVWQLHAAADGGRLVFGASERNLVDARYMQQDAYVLDLADGSYRRVVDVPGKLGDLRLSPDGAKLAWTGAATVNDHSTSTLWLTDVATGGTRDLTPDDYQGHLRHVAWRDGRTLLVQADQGTATVLAEVRADRDWSARKTVYDGPAIVAMPAVRPGAKTAVLVAHDPATPRELYAWRGGNDLLRLTHHNPWLADVDLARQEVVRWTARDGLEIEGILIHPLHGDGPAPLIVDVHGGPESHLSHGWVSRYAELGQAAAARGYAVLMPNYRGSTGRGLAFAASSFGDPAGKEFDDIVDGVDHLVALGVADRDRVGVTGGSYGGYATYWLSTYYSDRFAAGAGFVGVSDLVSKRYLTDIPLEDELVHMGATVDQSWDLMRERSPIAHAAKSRTPLLIMHGDSDTRVHPSQSQELYRALKVAGHPAVRLVWYPGEGHGNSKRFGRMDLATRTLDWFDWYLMDRNPVDGPMPPRDLSGELGLVED